jgi:hypothetical protein
MGPTDFRLYPALMTRNDDIGVIQDARLYIYKLRMLRRGCEQWRSAVCAKVAHKLSAAIADLSECARRPLRHLEARYIDANAYVESTSCRAAAIGAMAVIGWTNPAGNLETASAAKALSSQHLRPRPSARVPLSGPRRPRLPGPLGSSNHPRPSRP